MNLRRISTLLSSFVILVSSFRASGQQFALDYRAGTTGIFTQKTITTAPNRLLGTLNGSDPVAITLGTGLSFSGSTLNAAGSGLTIASTTITGGTNGYALINNAGTLAEVSLADAYQPLNPNLTAIAAAPISEGFFFNDGSNGLSYLPRSSGAGLSSDASKVAVHTTGGRFFANDYIRVKSSAAADLSATPNLEMNASSKRFTYAHTSTDRTLLTFATPSGVNEITIPARTGTLITTGDTGTVTDAMLAGSIALSKLATTGTANSTTYLRGDGAWTSISSGATLGANTFTALQQFSGTDHAGLRLNNLTTTQRDALTGAAGMVIWNTTDGRMQLHNGTSWTSGMVRLAGDTMTGQLQIAQGTLTSSAPLSVTQTWNSGTPGTGAFSMLTLNATLTNASSTSSGFLTCLRDGTTRFFMDSGGITYFGGANAGTATCVIDTNNVNVSLRSSAHLDWMGDTKLYRLAAGVLAPRAANSTTGAALEFLEQTAPAAPSADRVRVYAEDNGSGKTRLVVRWSDGTTTVLATQP